MSTWCQHETTGHRIGVPAPDGEGRTDRLFPCALTDQQVSEYTATIARSKIAAAEVGS